MKTPIPDLRKAAVAAASATLALATAVFCGCESADSYEISVKPGNATVTSAAPSVALTASGWRDFQWALSDTSLGYLSSSKGDSVVYTARSGTFVGGRQTITVTAVGSGTSGSSSGSSTNATASAGGYTAQAVVTHKDETVVETETTETESAAGPAAESETKQTSPAEEKETPAATPALALTLAASPSQITSTNGYVWLTASVKEPQSGVSYKWSADIGTLSKTSGDTTMLSPPANPANGEVATVTCTATCKGYEGTTATKSIPFKITN